MLSELLVHESTEVFPNLSQMKETEAVGVCWAWTQRAEDLGKGQFPQMCWCSSAKHPLHAHVCCVSHVVVLATCKTKQTSLVSQQCSGNVIPDLCIPFPPFPIVLFQPPIPYSFCPNIPPPAFQTLNVSQDMAFCRNAFGKTLVHLKNMLFEVRVEMLYTFNVFMISHTVLQIQVFLCNSVHKGEHQTQINCFYWYFYAWVEFRYCKKCQVQALLVRLKNLI